MSLSVTEQADLTPLNTLGITARADYLVHITAADQIPEAVALAQLHNLPLLPLGSGSNIVIGTDQLHATVAKIEIGGRATTPADGHTVIRVGAGENWDAVVAWTVEQGLHGLENLSLVPGTVGAAPVQNVGAYGREVSETITTVEAYDLETSRQVTLTNQDCDFSYRNSVFKQAGKGRYIITAVNFQLTPQSAVQLPTYATLRAELERRGQTEPTIQGVRDAVIAVRRARLPDPAVTPTAGSFFHNPVVARTLLAQIQEQHPNVPFWEAGSDQVKLAAAWLVEQTGLKGVLRGGVGLYDKQAICLINPGHRPARDVLAFRDYVIATVHDRFGVTLQMEPELIS